MTPSPEQPDVTESDAFTELLGDRCVPQFPPTECDSSTTMASGASAIRSSSAASYDPFSRARSAGTILVSGQPWTLYMDAPGSPVSRGGAPS